MYTETILKRLSDEMPAEFVGGEYHHTPAYALRNATVHERFSRHEDGWQEWPGTQNNVHVWCIVNTGNGFKAVGWNENPSRGWSFPVLNLPNYPRLPSKAR